MPHGSFLPWIEQEFGMSDRAANRFMNVATEYGAKSARLAGLGLEAMYELAAPSSPPEVQAEVERRIAAGELVLLGFSDLHTFAGRMHDG